MQGHVYGLMCPDEKRRRMVHKYQKLSLNIPPLRGSIESDGVLSLYQFQRVMDRNSLGREMIAIPGG